MFIFLKKHKTKIAFLLILATVWFFKPNSEPKIETIKASKMDLKQEVSVVGTVEASKNAKLAFENSGKIQKIFVDVNSKVSAGQIVASLNTADLQSIALSKQALVQAEEAKALQIQSSIDSEMAKLKDLENGVKPEEITLNEAKVQTKVKELEQIESEITNLENKLNTEIKTNLDLLKGLNSKSLSESYVALLKLSNIQEDYFAGNSQTSIRFAGNKSAVVRLMYGVTNAGSYNTMSISKLTGGVFDELDTLDLNIDSLKDFTEKNLEILNALISAFRNIELQFHTNKESLTEIISTQLSILETSKKDLNTQLANTLQLGDSFENSMDVKRNQKTIISNALNEAEKNLDLIKSGNTQESIDSQKSIIEKFRNDLKAQQANILSAKANLSETNSLIAKKQIRAPFSGIITEKFFEEGEIILAESNLFELISESKYQIKANVPESDISKIKLEQKVTFTLDAYDENEVFEAVVSKINPAAKEIEGVPVYEVEFNFSKEYDKVKSGMTANLDILTASVTGVIAVPLRSLNGSIIKLLTEDGSILEKEVEVGLIGSDGFVEIKNGLDLNDKVITFYEETD